MTSYSDTHFTNSAPSHGSAGIAPALGGAVVAMSLRNPVPAGRTRGGLDTDGREALVVRCART